MLPFLLILTSPTLADTSFEIKCYSKEDFVKTMDKMAVLTLYKGKNKDGKNEEFLIDVEKKSMYTVQYDPPEDGNAFGASKYCVTNVNTDVSINMKAIEFFNKLIERMQGMKI